MFIPMVLAARALNAAVLNEKCHRWIIASAGNGQPGLVGCDHEPA